MSTETGFACPYCGRANTLEDGMAIDGEAFVTDCEACCKPILIRVSSSSGSLIIDASRENE